MIVSYTVGETAVLEMPGVDESSSTPVFTRTLNIGPRERDMVLQVAEQPGVSHFEHPDFTGGTESVLDRSQYTIWMVALSFKVENRIHHVLQNLRTGQCTVLGHMSNEKTSG